MPIRKVSQGVPTRGQACAYNDCINTREIPMQVYAVMGGVNYEGECGETLRLFDCKSTAEAYAKELEDDRFDYVEFKLLDVVMHSALVA